MFHLKIYFSPEYFLSIIISLPPVTCNDFLQQCSIHLTHYFSLPKNIYLPYIFICFSLLFFYNNLSPLQHNFSSRVVSLLPNRILLFQLFPLQRIAVQYFAAIAAAKIIFYCSICHDKICV